MINITVLNLFLLSTPVFHDVHHVVRIGSLCHCQPLSYWLTCKVLFIIVSVLIILPPKKLLRELVLLENSVTQCNSEKIYLDQYY